MRQPYRIEPADPPTAIVTDAVFPTVVRRRIVDLAPEPVRPDRAGESEPSDASVSDLESPPSSIFAPHYNEPDGELDDVVDELIAADEDAPPSALLPSAPPSMRRVVRLPARASVSFVAKQLALPATEVAAELVCRGLFGVTSRTVITPAIESVLEQSYRCKIVRV